MTGPLQNRWSDALMNTYGVPGVALARGEGAVLTDADGTRYLDLLGGIAVNCLGHGHPAVVEAVRAQLATLGHVSNLYASEPPVALAEAAAVAVYGRSPYARRWRGGWEEEAAAMSSRALGRRGALAAAGLGVRLN